MKSISPLMLSPDYIPIKEVKKTIPLHDKETWKKIEDEFFLIVTELKQYRQRLKFSRFLGKSDTYISQNESRVKATGIISFRSAKIINNIVEEYTEFIKGTG